jgi:transcriptional regulator with XRE-family HTH domain
MPNLHALLHTSQREIADKLGVSHPRMSRWVSGIHPVPLEYVGKLSRILGVSPFDIRPDLRDLGPEVVEFLNPESALPVGWPPHGP